MHLLNGMEALLRLDFCRTKPNLPATGRTLQLSGPKSNFNFLLTKLGGGTNAIKLSTSQDSRGMHSPEQLTDGQTKMRL